MLSSDSPLALLHELGCRGANRTLIASAKGSRPAIERPGITLSTWQRMTELNRRFLLERQAACH